MRTGNGANVDNVAGTTVGALLEDGKDGLGHVYEARDVGLEHDIDVLLLDVRGLVDTPDQATDVS